MNRQQRLKKGYDFFYNLSPSKVKPIHIIWLHEWMRLLDNEKKVLLVEDLSDEKVEDIFK